MRIYLLGMMGAGKTHWGKAWAQHYNLSFRDLDEEIESLEGQTVSLIFDDKGEAYFREKERKVLHKTSEIQNTIIALGGGTPCFFDNMEWINKHGKSIWLKISPGIIMQRLGRQSVSRPLLQSLSSAEKELFLETLLKKREKFYSQANASLDAESCTITSLNFLLEIKK
ncbi:MAG: shikimate kinase [Ferruginibacter sp.]